MPGLLLAAVLTSSAQAVPDEYRLKAAFLFRFPQFVEWPTGAFERRPTLDLCVLEPNPFGSVLRELVAGETIEGRQLAVRVVTPNDVSGCHLLYLPQTLRARPELIQRISQLPILTVSDAPSFLDEGGIVRLRLVANRVRFEIGLAAAERAGLRISPQLLRLALRVRGGQS